MLKVTAPKQVSAQSASPVHNTSVVTLSVYNPGYAKNTDIKGLPFNEVKILTSEPISWSIETSWKDGAAAGVAGKINEFMNNKFVRMVTGPELFSPIATDAWSQQVVENGSPIRIKLKFKCYYAGETPTENNLLTCDKTYSQMLRFLTYLTSAPKKYALGMATLGVVSQLAKGVVNTGERIGTAVRGKPAEEGTVAATIKYTVAALGEQAGVMMPGSGDEATRGNFTLLVDTKNFGSKDLDWIVKSWSAAPSTQFVMDKKDRPMPLWIDFDVDLETNMRPSNALVAKFFSKKSQQA